MQTAGKPEQIKLSVIQSPKGWKADGADMVLLQVEVMDKDGRRCSLYYQKYGHFDEALEMERKAYASQLMLNDQTGDTKIILSSALGVFGVMSLLLGLLWKKNKFVYP